MPRFIVPVEIEIQAKNATEAEEIVLSFLEYGLETANDEGTIKFANLSDDPRRK